MRATQWGKAFSKAALMAAPALPAPMTTIRGARFTAFWISEFAKDLGIKTSGRTASTAACQIANAWSRMVEIFGGSATMQQPHGDLKQFLDDFAVH
jgi:hypothetical protein